MLISCEKCSTTYVLDDALIPPQGAPVQCTRCSHVFTARLSQAQPENTPAPAAPRPAAAWESPELANRPANSTLVFGGGSPGPGTRPPPGASAAASPSAPASQTMMFGTPAGQARGAAAPPPPAAAGASKTLVFGGGAAPAPGPPAAKPGQTIAFGAPAHVPSGPSGPAAPAGQSNQTVIFGTPALQQQPAPAPVVATPAKTIPFGGGADQGANRTVIFGMPGAPAAPPPPAASGNQTMVFGAPTVSPQLAQAEAEARNQTMMFGRPAGAKDTPKVTVGSAEPAGYAMGDELPTESTVRVDLDALGAGKEALTDDSPQVRHDRTVLFAMQDGQGAPLQPPPGDERQNRTVLFAMNPADGAGPAEPTLPPPQTMIFGVRPGAAPPAATPRGIDVGSLMPGADEQAGNTAPELPSLQSPSLELPPEDRFARSLAERATANVEAGDADVASLRAAANRRTTIAVIIFLVLALALAAVLAWYLFGRALVGGSQAAIEAQAREAVALLRRDDAAAHQEAIAKARALLTRAPSSVEARSAVVLGTALAADDASAQARRDRLGVEALQRRLENLSVASPSREELTRQLTAQRDAARRSGAEAEAAQASLKQETEALLTLAQAQQLPTAQQLAALRARSISLAVQGEATSLALAEEFNQKSGGSKDNWADLALPEYVANGGSSYDEALRQLEAVEARDDTFLRAYVLSARISLLRKDRPGAEAQLAKVLAFHPGHDAAQQLLAWVRSHPESD